MYDLKTGRPVVYISSDAHALRRYVDDTWARQWKMANGIRIWAVDRATGENIHLGGEFTWGDCAKVAEIFAELIKMGILPKGGIYGDDLRAQFVWVSDGAPWFRERVIPLFEGGIIEILDLYHVLEHASRYADEALPKSQKKAWLERFKQVLFVTETQPSLELSVIAETPRRLELVEPKLASSQNVPKINPPRKGNRKTFDTDRKRRKLFDIAARAQRLASVGTATERLALIFPANGSGANEDTQIRAQADFMRYLGNNDDRIDYAEMQSRGLQIGSGAMESLHRSGSQVRLKRAGATYLLETSQAIFNVRMLRLSGRWDEFWGQENIARKLAESWGLPGTTDESTKAA